MNSQHMRSIAALALATAGALTLMGIITAEALYPAGYTTSGNQISDLGATAPPNSISFQPSASIFDVTMMVVGALVIAAGAMFVAMHSPRFLSLMVIVNGVGILGVGVFPANLPDVHRFFAAAAFIAGGLSGIAGARATSGVLRYFSLTLGIVTLASLIYLVLGDNSAPIGSDLGDGGAERWVAYPVVMWQVVMGGALMGERNLGPLTSRREPAEST